MPNDLLPLLTLRTVLFSIDGPKQNAGSLWTPVSDTFFTVFLSHDACALRSGLHGISHNNRFFKDSDWPLKNFDLLLKKLP